MSFDQALAAQIKLLSLIESHEPKLKFDESQNLSEGETTIASFEEKQMKEVEDFLINLRDFIKAQEKSSKMKESILEADLQSASSEVFESKINGSRETWCAKMSEHLDTILDNRDMISWLLQQPVHSHFLNIPYYTFDEVKNLIQNAASFTDPLVKVGSCDSKRDLLQKTEESILYLSDVLKDMKHIPVNIDRIRSSKCGRTDPEAVTGQSL